MHHKKFGGRYDRLAPEGRLSGARVCMKQAQQSADREVTCEARRKAQSAKRDASVKSDKRK